MGNLKSASLDGVYPQSGERLEAPSGFEPLHKGFADLSLSHLGTAPHELQIIPPGSGIGLKA